MLVEIIEKIKEIAGKKNLINYISMIVSVFLLFQVLNTYAAVDYSTLPKLDVVKGYQSETALTKSATGDPSYNAQTTTMNIVMGALNGTLQNLAPQTLSNYQAIKDNPDIPEFAKVGAIGVADNAVYTMMDGFQGVNIPRYLAQEWVPGYSNDTGIFAATDGYTYLQETNIDALWDRIRLICYVFFVVILIVAGFMIMFRQKIGGQLAVSIFNVIPNVIVSLILVTFSFAIVGLMINLGIMAVNVIGSVIGVSSDQAIVVDSPFSLVGALFSGEQLTGGIKEVFAGAGVAGILAAIAAFVVGTAATGGTALVAATVVLLFIAIAIAAIVIYASVRVYLTILMAYLSIIFNTLLGPIMLTFAAFPGQQGMISTWINNLAKAVLTFPVVFFFLNLGAFLLNGDINISFPSGFMTGDISNVAAGSDSMIGVLLKVFAVIALFFFAADAPKMLDDFLPSNSGKGAMEAIGGFRKGLSRIPIVGSFFA